MTDPGQKVSLAGRIALSLFFLCYGALALSNGADRLVAQRPGVERWVPGPFRASADRASAVRSLATGNIAEGRAHAERAVSADPLEAASLSLLGSAFAAQGAEAEAATAFRKAAELGWRDRLTQLYWFDRAMRSGDVERASLRADALLRTDPGLGATADLFEPLEATDAGRQALARRLADRPGWLLAYFQPGRDPELGMLKRRAAVALEVGHVGTLFGCASVRLLVGALVERGARRDAEAVWRAHCDPTLQPGTVSDLGFEQTSSSGLPMPFGWRKMSSGDVALAIVPDGHDGHVVRARNSASVSRLLLVQAVALEPGRYRATAKVANDDGEASDRVVVTLDCGTAASRPGTIEGYPGLAGQVLTIGSCDSQTIGIWIRPGPGGVEIDDLALERLR